MAFRISVSPKAQKEIENAIDYYAMYSIDAPINFISELKNTHAGLRLCLRPTMKGA